MYVHDVYSGTARRIIRYTVGDVDRRPSKLRVLEPTHPRRADPLPTIVRPLTHSDLEPSCDTQTAPQVGKSRSWHFRYLVGLGEILFLKKKSVVIGLRLLHKIIITIYISEYASSPYLPPPSAISLVPLALDDRSKVRALG